MADDDELLSPAAPASAPASAAVKQAAQPEEPPKPGVAVAIETDADGNGSADVEVNGFDVLDAHASDGSDAITWNVVDPFTTRVTLQEAKTKSGAVTVTLDTK